MGPILKLSQPVPGVGIIKIYQPTLIKNNTVSFLVLIDGKPLAFNLHQDGEWNEINKEGIAAELVLFIQQKIEALYNTD